MCSEVLQVKAGLTSDFLTLSRYLYLCSLMILGNFTLCPEFAGIFFFLQGGVCWYLFSAFGSRIIGRGFGELCLIPYDKKRACYFRLACSSRK